MKFRLFIAIVSMVLLTQRPASANPTQFGSSGLLNVPSADTLDSANFCFGAWGNCSKNGATGITSIMPVTLTLGIGTFWELYGTYPNVWLNGEAPDSGRGTTDVGTKIRFYGSRSSRFKVAADLHLSRYIDDDPKYNGKNDMGGRLIASLRSDLLAAHLYGGYMANGQSRQVVSGVKSTKEYPVGGGLEYSPTNRSKTTFELLAADAANPDAPIEASLGYQYYLTPHLTFNLSYAMGLNAAAADWRVLFGLSTCQGVGAYIKPVPEVRRKDGKGLKAGELTRPFKVLPLSPLLIKTPELTTPASKFEIPVDAEGDEILVRPYGTVVIPQQAVAKAVTPKLEMPEQAPAAVEEPVAAMPVIIPDGEQPSEYSLTRVSGVTPLYGIRLKGPKTVTAVAKVPQQPVTAYRKFRLPDNLFEFDNAEMIPEVQKSVAELAEFIRKDTKWVFLRIDGHTDGVGSVKYNMDLSLRRAISVANYLITREGIDPSRIFVRGMGKSAPIADNSTDEGRKLNRRFEIVFLVHKEKVK
jgi:outer membrane protein OmpA-like peptidoglycan-associated protein